jgi:hypothetical protein
MHGNNVCFQSSLFPSSSTTKSVSLSLDEDSNLGLHRNNILPTSVPLADNSIPHGDDDITNNVLDDQGTFGRSHIQGVWKASEWGPVSMSTLSRKLQFLLHVFNKER